MALSLYVEYTIFEADMDIFFINAGQFGGNFVSVFFLLNIDAGRKCDICAFTDLSRGRPETIKNIIKIE